MSNTHMVGLLSIHEDELLQVAFLGDEDSCNDFRFKWGQEVDASRQIPKVNGVACYPAICPIAKLFTEKYFDLYD